MPKQGQHNNDDNDPDVSRGRNNPSKSVDMTAGTPKNQETYQQQAAQGGNTGDENARGGGGDGAAWDDSTRDPNDVPTRARDSDITSGRSGSDSNANK